MANDRVVQRAVRLDVRDGRAGSSSTAIERAELIDHRIGQLVGLHVDESATEPGEVGVADVGPDRDVVLDCHLAGAADDRRVARVEPAGDVRRRDDGHQLPVGAARPRPEAFADIAVQIDGAHHGS